MDRNQTERNRKLNIGILSTCSKLGDVEGNLRQIECFAKKAGINGCEILLTPEMSVTGYGSYPEVTARGEEAGQGEIYRGLAKIAAENNLVVLAGFPEKEGEKYFLSHYIVYPDGHYLVQRKHRVSPVDKPLYPAVELPYEDTGENVWLSLEEERFRYFFVNGLKCVVVICADFGIRNLNEILKRNSVDVVFLPVGAGGNREQRVTDEELKTEAGRQKYCSIWNPKNDLPDQTMLDCIEYGRCNVAVNMCGYDGKNSYHSGSGSIISQFGELITYLPGIQNIDRQKPTFACGEIDLNETL